MAGLFFHLDPWLFIQYAVFPDIFFKILGKYPNSKAYLGIPIHQNDIASFAFERAFHRL